VLAQDKPNILIIWGDDIGYWNISAYNQGMMGYQTPNIDFVMVPAQVFVGRFPETYKEYPPRQKPGSFSIDQVLEKMKSSGTN
jgi:hypothetical protein